MTAPEAKELIPPFIEFVKSLDGDEKSEAQNFLNRLFQAFGHAGSLNGGGEGVQPTRIRGFSAVSNKRG